MHARDEGVSRKMKKSEEVSTKISGEKAELFVTNGVSKKRRSNQLCLE